jgi:cytochrome c oxidase subunit 2
VTLTKKLILLGLIMNLIIHSVPFRTEAAESSQVVKITASKFHFTPDRITLVKGHPVTLQLTATDTTHGFMIRALKIDTDIKPGTVNEITVTPGTAGTFRAICDHYCGLGHAAMKMTVVVEETAAKSPAAEVFAASNMKAQQTTSRLITSPIPGN